MQYARVVFSTLELCDMWKIVCLQSPDLLKIVSTSIVSSRLDYCISLLSGTTKSNIGRLQRVQNTLARLVTGTKKFDHIEPVLSELHWLPVSSRITFKVALLTRKILSTNQPSYLADMISPYQPPRNLRISTMKKLTVPGLNGFRTAMSRRAFCFEALELWNGLPPDVTDLSVSMAVFRESPQNSPFQDSLWQLIDIVTTQRLWFFGYLSFEFLETDGVKHKFVYLLTYLLT